MENVKDFIGKSLLNKRVRFKCECLLPFDVTGVVSSYNIVSNEVVWKVEVQRKHIEIGENNPKLSIEVLS